jgi:hypothetical protein
LNFNKHYDSLRVWGNAYLHEGNYKVFIVDDDETKTFTVSVSGDISDIAAAANWLNYTEDSLESGDGTEYLPNWRHNRRLLHMAQ